MNYILETLAALIVFFIVCYALSPKKKSSRTYVFFEDENSVLFLELTSSLRETKPSSFTLIGMFTGTLEEASNVKDLLEKVKKYRESKQNSSHL